MDGGRQRDRRERERRGDDGRQVSEVVSDHGCSGLIGCHAVGLGPNLFPGRQRQTATSVPIDSSNLSAFSDKLESPEEANFSLYPLSNSPLIFPPCQTHERPFRKNLAVHPNQRN